MTEKSETNLLDLYKQQVRMMITNQASLKNQKHLQLKCTLNVKKIYTINQKQTECFLEVPAQLKNQKQL